MTQPNCDCGKPSNNSGYCDNCLKIINEQIAREMTEEHILVDSDTFNDYLDQSIKDGVE